MKRVTFKSKIELEVVFNLPLPIIFNDGGFLLVNKNGSINKKVIAYTIKEVVEGNNFILQ